MSRFLWFTVYKEYAHIDADTFILQIVVAIYLAALASQASRFVEVEFESVNVTSRIDPATVVTGCRYTLTPLIHRYQQVGIVHTAMSLATDR